LRESWDWRELPRRNNKSTHRCAHGTRLKPAWIVRRHFVSAIGNGVDCQQPLLIVLGSRREAKAYLVCRQNFFIPEPIEIVLVELCAFAVMQHRLVTHAVCVYRASTALGEFR